MRKILLFLFALGGVGLASLQGEDVLPNPVTSQQLEALLSKVHYMAPTYQEMEALKGPYGKLVRLGYLIFTQTTVYAAKYVGDGLECSNCHLDAGKLAYSAPLWAAYAHYPAYRTKNHQVNSYQQRLQGCFKFSENGTPPPLNSTTLKALEAYSAWLAKGLPIQTTLPGRGYPELPKLTPDPKEGAVLYQEKCAVCHMPDGQGQMKNGRYVFPPLWGPHSYNTGAGMHKVSKLAAFIRGNMPLGEPYTITPQEAWDIAAFVDSHPRPIAKFKP